MNRLERRKKLRGWIYNLIIILLFTIFFREIILIGKVDGKSMEPNFSDSNLVVIKAFNNEFNRDEVISFEYGVKQQNFLKIKQGEDYAKKNEEKVGTAHLKRIYGVPGDLIQIKKEGNTNVLIVNGIKELVFESDYSVFHDILEENEYFVIGDNYEISFDSRLHGPISKEQIIGSIIGT